MRALEWTSISLAPVMTMSHCQCKTDNIHWRTHNITCPSILIIFKYNFVDFRSISPQRVNLECERNDFYDHHWFWYVTTIFCLFMVEMATSMLVADVEDQMLWRQHPTLSHQHLCSRLKNSHNKNTIISFKDYHGDWIHICLVTRDYLHSFQVQVCWWIKRFAMGRW